MVGLAGLAVLPELAGLAGLGECWMGSFWVPKPLIWEAWWLHLGTLGGHLGYPGVPGDTPQDTWGSIGGWGVRPTGKSFRFVRACARSGCKVGMHIRCHPHVFPFPFWPREAFPFPFGNSSS